MVAAAPRDVTSETEIEELCEQACEAWAASLEICASLAWGLLALKDALPMLFYCGKEQTEAEPVPFWSPLLAPTPKIPTPPAHVVLGNPWALHEAGFGLQELRDGAITSVPALQVGNVAHSYAPGCVFYVSQMARVRYRM